jgi:hypothetical protein
MCQLRAKQGHSTARMWQFHGSRVTFTPSSRSCRQFRLFSSDEATIQTRCPLPVGACMKVMLVEDDRDARRGSGRRGASGCGVHRSPDGTTTA